MLLQTFSVWAALSGAVFSFSVQADDVPQIVSVVTEKEKKPSIEWSSVEILRGEAVKRYEPPLWFARRVPPTLPQVVEPDSFVYDPPKVSSSMGRPPNVGPQYACRRTNGTWVFCD